MWLGRVKRALEALDRECERAAEDEERANFELARSARAFSQRARAGAEDKLTFSAVLVRAGEVTAAERLIRDLELDVRAEESALADRVAQVEVAAASRRTKVTRLRLARMLALAVAAAGLLSFSAAGLAVTAFVAELGDDSAERSPRSRARTAQSNAPHQDLRSIRLPDGTTVELTRVELRAGRELAAKPQLSRAELERLLVKFVGPRAAGLLANALAAAALQAGRASDGVGTGTKEVTSRLGEVRSQAAQTDDHSAIAPAPRRNEPLGPSDEPSGNPAGDDGIIDTPLGVDPELPGLLGGD